MCLLKVYISNEYCRHFVKMQCLMYHSVKDCSFYVHVVNTMSVACVGVHKEIAISLTHIRQKPMRKRSVILSLFMESLIILIISACFNLL